MSRKTKIENLLVSQNDQALYDKFMLESEELLRTQGQLKDDQLDAALRFLESTFLDDLENDKKG